MASDIELSSSQQAQKNDADRANGGDSGNQNLVITEVYDNKPLKVFSVSDVILATICLSFFIFSGLAVIFWLFGILILLPFLAWLTWRVIKSLRRIIALRKSTQPNAGKVMVIDAFMGLLCLYTALSLTSMFVKF